MSVQLITELRPVLIQRCVGDFSDADYWAVLQESTQWLKQELHIRSRSAIIMDLRASGQLTAQQRKLQNDWLRDNRRLLEEVCVGTAFVVKSSMVRAVLSSILWMQPLPCPYSVLTKTDAALRWCIEQLKCRGIFVDKDLRSLKLAAKPLSGLNVPNHADASFRLESDFRRIVR